MTQNNLGTALRDLGERSTGEKAARVLREAVEVYQQALTVRLPETSQPLLGITQINLGEAFFLLKDWPNAANSFIKALTFLPNYESGYQKATFIYHDILFNYQEAFRVNQQWVEHKKGTVSAEAYYAEKHFTTARFSECEQRIAKLLVQSNLETNTEVALQAIEIANLLALGKENLISAKIDSLIAAVASQPVDFQVKWQFDGTRNFIGQHEKLSSHRAWLIQLFEAIKGSNREAILKGLQEVKAKFKQ